MFYSICNNMKNQQLIKARRSPRSVSPVMYGPQIPFYPLFSKGCPAIAQLKKVFFSGEIKQECDRLLTGYTIYFIVDVNKAVLYLRLCNEEAEMRLTTTPQAARM